MNVEMIKNLSAMTKLKLINFTNAAIILNVTKKYIN